MAYNPLNPNGQASMAASQPIVIASNQSPVSVLATLTSGSILAVPTGNQSVSGTVGASIIGTSPVTQAGTWIASVFGNVSVLGTVPVTQATTPWVMTGSVQGSFTPSGNQSVSGTVQTQVQASVAVVIIGGSILTSSTANQSVSGTVGASIIGNVPVTITSVATVGGFFNVNLVGGSILTSSTPNQSVSGTVGASIIGLTPVSVSNFPTTQNVSGSVVAFQGTSPWITAVQSSVAVAIVSGSISGTFGASVIGLPPYNLTQVASSPVAVTSVTSGIQKVGISDSLGQSISAFPATFLRTTDEPHQLFYDAFDTAIDTTNRWTVTSGNAGVAASNTSGVMVMGTGTTANGFSKLVSQPTFTLPIPAWLGASDAIALPDGAAPISNSYRYWGTGTTPGTPSVATPVTDGYGFELNTDGKLRAVVYAGGTRTVIQDLSTSGNSTQPLDANYHRYIIYIRTDKAYWYIDGITSGQLVATSNFQSSQVQTLPRLFLAIGNGTPPVSNTQLQCTGATAWDTGKNSNVLADGIFPYRRATIKNSVTAAVTTDTALVVALHPSSPLPSGNNTIGTIQSIIGTYAEDAASNNNDPGIFTLGVRNDALSSLVSANGDYTGWGTDSAGRHLIKPFTSEDGTIISYVGSVVSGSVTLIQASVLGKRSYITDFFVANTGAATTLLTFQDGSASIIGYTIAPTTGGSNAPGIAIPIKTNPSQDLAFKVSPSTSILYLTVKGYVAP